MDASPPLHPTDQILHAYGLGTLGGRAASAVDSHLEDCDVCRRRVSELSGDDFLGRLRDAASPARPVDPAPGAPAPLESNKADGPSDPALARSLPPELVNHAQYRVIRELGRGGMGIVYLARNTILDRLEVLKVLNKEMLGRKGTRERFLREMQAAARLNHPNIVGAYAALVFDSLLVFAMEYVDGEDLAAYVKSRGPRPVMQACAMIYQAALGLQHAHEQGMVHRDIKPGNLMFARQGQRVTVKVLDFGLAKATSENPFDGSLTREGQMLGTVDFIAPEQSLDAQKADIRADIYSLGCTLYYLLNGGPPFKGTSLASILQAHHSIEARPLNLARPGVPVELATVVRKMMAKEPPRRYQTPAEAASALRPFCRAGGTGSGSSDGERSRSARPAPPEAGAVVVKPAPPPAPEPEPEPADSAPAAAPVAAPRWESLIAIPEPEHLSDAKPATSKTGWRWPSHVGPFRTAAAFMLLVVIGWAVGVVKQRRDLSTASPGVAGVPKESTVEKAITNTIGMKLALIPAGEFLMGALDTDQRAWNDERPAHRVRITRPFYLGVHEVTQGQYREVTAGKPSLVKGSDEFPVEQVSWNDAIAFCDRLSEREGMRPYYKHGARSGSNEGYRLPTEAEWEYACRAGSTTRYGFGDDSARAGEYGWYGGNAGNRIHPVGLLRPNAFGLYDMHGNVWEWCGDCYGQRYYSQ